MLLISRVINQLYLLLSCISQIGRKRLKVQHKQERRYSSSAISSLARPTRTAMARFDRTAGGLYPSSASATSPLASTGYGGTTGTTGGGGGSTMDPLLPGRGWRSTLMQQQPQSSALATTPSGTVYRRPAAGYSPSTSPQVSHQPANSKRQTGLS